MAFAIDVDGLSMCTSPYGLIPQKLNRVKVVVYPKIKNTKEDMLRNVG